MMTRKFPMDDSGAGYDSARAFADTAGYDSTRLDAAREYESGFADGFNGIELDEDGRTGAWKDGYSDGIAALADEINSAKVEDAKPESEMDMDDLALEYEAGYEAGFNAEPDQEGRSGAWGAGYADGMDAAR